MIEGAEDTQLQYPFENVQIAPYDTDNVAFQDLGLGAGVRLDAIITNLVTAQPRLNEDKRFKLAGQPLYSEPNSVAIEKKGDTQWNSKVREVFRSVETRRNSEQTVAKKWIGADISK